VRHSHLRAARRNRLPCATFMSRNRLPCATLTESCAPQSAAVKEKNTRLSRLANADRQYSYGFTKEKMHLLRREREYASFATRHHWTPRAAHFEPSALCSFELLGVLGRRTPLTSSRAAARRSLRAARPLQPQAARRPLGRCAPLTSSRASFAATSCSEPSAPRASHSSRAPLATGTARSKRASK